MGNLDKNKLVLLTCTEEVAARAGSTEDFSAL